MDDVIEYIENNVTALASGILSTQGSETLTDESRALVVAGIRAGLNLQKKIEFIAYIQESYALDTFAEAEEVWKNWVALKTKPATVGA
jgi:hypothetical protein